MKNILLLLFTVTLLIPSVISAQEVDLGLKFSLFGGAVIPVGDFSETTGQNGGYAKTGFCGRLQASKNIDEIVHWVTSVSLAVNPVNTSVMEQQLSAGVSVTAGNYVTTWVLTGIDLEVVASPLTKFYGIFELGLLVSSFPDITLTFGDESIAQTTETATAFAFGLGGGLIFNKVTVGLRYYAGEPEYTQSASYNGYTSTEKVKLPVAILELIAGYNF